jgi:hypothetical protein
MPAHDKARQELVSRNAALSRWRPDDPRLRGIRAELATLKLIETITDEIAEAPPLTAEQLARISCAVYGNLDRVSTT